MSISEGKSSSRFQEVLVRGLIVLLSPFVLLGSIFWVGHSTAHLPGADTTMYVVYGGATLIVVESSLLQPEEREAFDLEDEDVLLLDPSFLSRKTIFKIVNADLRHELREAKTVRIMEVRLVESQPMNGFRWTGPEYRDEEVFLIDGERKMFKNALVVWTGTFDFEEGTPTTPARRVSAGQVSFCN